MGIQYGQAHDRNKHCSNRVADFVPIPDPQYGEVKDLFQFVWRNGEEMTVAVVQPWTTRPWLPLTEKQFPNQPRQLVGMEQRLQAMSVDALRNIVGRVSTIGQGGSIVLDCTLGSLETDMADNPQLDV